MEQRVDSNYCVYFCERMISFSLQRTELCIKMPASILKDYIANGPEHLLPALVTLMLAGITQGVAAAIKESDEGEN